MQTDEDLRRKFKLITLHTIHQFQPMGFHDLWYGQALRGSMGKVSYIGVK